MLSFGVAKMHKRLFLGLVDATPGAIRFLKGCLRLGRDGRQSLERFQRQPGNELRVAKALVITAVSEELAGILQEESNILVTDTGLPSDFGPISITGAVQRDNKIVDGFRFGGNLTKGDASAFKSRPRIGYK